ncbi:chemotaxis protein CheA [Pelotomaculum propionicicum]|uniref:Chemotaxis protein CheA n=1 Tax=Pelotomaculum propionicicum TaxID=258475 RepID=A0A4Y7RSQ7_9FIRM|nr:chemotaxis protein CheA [Pelotomaculum propionicicum]TEB11901.1 Chemotaxis protein CheA [Pelotomaculum propionicicum]
MANGDYEEKLEMVKYFINDSRELLDDVEPQIIAMEEKALSTGEIDGVILNAIFRLFHSLKGSASFLDLQTIISVTHEAETLLDIFRNGQAAVKPAHVDLLIRTTDFIRNILDVVEQQLSDEGYEDSAAVIVDDLQKTIANVMEGGTEEEENINAGCDLPAAEEEQPGDEGEYIPTGNLDDMGLDITPEIMKHFIEESIEILDEAESALLALEKAPGDNEIANRAFRAFHSFKGNSGFLGYADLEEISHHAESLLGQARDLQKPCDPVAISFMLIALDILRDGIRQIDLGVTPELSGKAEVCTYLEKLAREMAPAEDQGLKEKEQAAAPPEKPAQPEVRQEKTSQPVKEPNGEASVKSSAEQEAGDSKERQQVSGQQQAIRVDLEKLDKLLDLVGELVISEAMVANNPDLRGLQLDRFEKAVLQLDKITRDIQEVAMSMRMIPLSGTFRKMVRLVRDLAQKANKKVTLEITGEETEVDKTIIEQISDPLVHLIRNAVDHGIESAEERLAAGKPETGRVSIEAKHSAGEVWIVVEDDGKGLDRDRIFNKAVEKGLLRSEDRDLKDEEVFKLIFEPGFSTAEKVSSISGRGVGMDVVKRNIEKLRGKVDVRSRPGSGTMFAVRIPLTLAIIEGMVVKVGQNRYTIPINSIKESLQPKEGQITRTPDNLELVSIRGELLPVIRLHELYQVSSNFRRLTDGILIVVENEEKKCSLFVDEVIGQQQIVIKGLSSYLGHVKSISGCAILGDGDISMILDIDDLINSVEGVLN